MGWWQGYGAGDNGRPKHRFQEGYIEVMKKDPVSLCDRNGEVVAAFYSVSREGDKLVIDAKALDVMRMDMIITPAQVLKGLRMLVCWPVISFILLLPYFALRRLVIRKGGE